MYENSRIPRHHIFKSRPEWPDFSSTSFPTKEDPSGETTTVPDFYLNPTETLEKTVSFPVILVPRDSHKGPFYKGTYSTAQERKRSKVSDGVRNRVPGKEAEVSVVPG